MRHQLLLLVLIPLQRCQKEFVIARDFLKIFNKCGRKLVRGGYVVGLDEGVDGSCNEQKDNDGRYYGAYYLKAHKPLLVVPADGLEHAPEAVVYVQEDCDEPYHVEGHDPPFPESGYEQEVRILRFISHELLQLHLCPEMVKMEAEEAKHYDTQDSHVLCGPGVVLRLGGDLVTLYAAALFDVLIAEPYTIYYMHEEAKCEDGNHHVYERGGHEVAAKLEPAVSGGEADRIVRNLAEHSVEGVYDREKVNCPVKEQEDDEESAGNALYELLADG